ncbi:MAG: TetR/AcrR family transcriptional regulator [Azonexus sp.]|nr:TetR/AcrR family transcriptional regulator [Azonexus sp.]
MPAQVPSPSVPARRRGRPPKQTNGLCATREALLQAGLARLTEKGFSATGLEEILSQVGVPKGSFYHYFASKEAFGLALIDRYAAYFADKLDRFLLNPGRRPLDRLRDFVDHAKAGMARHDFQRGCLIGNLGQEMGALPGAFRQRLIDVFNDWQQRVAACLALAVEAGEIPPTADCQRLASAFWIGWEGAVLRAKLEGSAEPLGVFSDFFFAGMCR